MMQHLPGTFEYMSQAHSGNDITETITYQYCGDVVQTGKVAHRDQSL
jgi:hypothetical protein